MKTINEYTAILSGLINQLISRFNRHLFFKEKDMEEWMPFISKYLYNKGIYVMPCGSAWYHETTKENVEEYLKEYSDLFKEYTKWCDSQR